MEIKPAVAKHVRRDNKNSRPRKEGCWSFCGQPGDCILELLGLCRKSLPRFEASPPNQGADRMRSLTFGRRDYDAEVLIYQREFSKNYAISVKTKSMLILPPDWRKNLSKPDPWALVPITHEAKKYIKHEKDAQVWNADLLEDMLLGNFSCISHSTSEWVSKVILAVNNLACTIENSALLQNEREKAKTVLMSLFNTDYKSTLFTKNPAYTKTWQVATQVFLAATPIILDFLLESFFRDQEEWVALLVKHKAKLNYGVDIDYLRPQVKLRNRDVNELKEIIKNGQSRSEGTGITKSAGTSGATTGIKLRKVSQIQENTS